MLLKDFYYELPAELIAQDPLADRSASRLMVVERRTGKVSHDAFKNIANYLNAGDCLVLNDTRVIPARLFGTRADTGAPVEIFLLTRKENSIWECLVKPGKKARPGHSFDFSGIMRGEIICVLEDGNRLIRFDFDGIFEKILDRLGQIPLPPYITHALQDKKRYQTVYAARDGSVAAPTAGLHFTNELLSSIREKGIETAKITLHVGLGTFRPVKEANVLDHHMHSEFYSVSKEAADIISNTRAKGGRIICVGTTSTRALESVAAEDGTIVAGSGWTDIFIYPGYRFKTTDCLITNFHLPESTLLMLVSAFSSRDIMLSSYEEAIRERYRFFSFGDAMLIH
ncbi:MAG: tRNA preQ1(34) S-adenosylmethionine ribosyltransferase-isomerase QueA [Lachnospiraceae bacterium]|jgi:S-adenosylmethionine:tRNA ribosyltransferase-isomerase